jgi:hypothetical protein
MWGPSPVRRSVSWTISVWTLLPCALITQQAAAQALPPAVVACMDEHDATRRLACYDREVPRAVAATRRPAAPGSASGASASGSQLTPALSSGTPARASASSAQAPQPTTPPATATTLTSPATAGTPAPTSAATASPRPAAATGASMPAPLSEVDAFGMTPQIQQKENHGTPPPRLDKLSAHITAVSQKPAGESVVTLDNGQVWEEAEATSHLPLRTGDNITIKRGMLGAFYMSSRQVLGLRVKRVR